ATVPSASGTVSSSPPRVSLTYSEAVEPRFAIVSVTNAAGEQKTAGSPARSPSNPDQLDVPLQHLDEGWYLVYWRVVSVDGHPVRGAFTFAVGPNPGPAPQFVIPSISETAATPGLLIARWAVFLSVMAAIGLLVFRAVIARPVRQRVPGSSLRTVTIAFLVAVGTALVATPIYVYAATAKFSLRSIRDIGALTPLLRESAFGRSMLDLELILALLAIASVILLRVERPDSRQRPISELLALVGALLAAGAAVLVPGLAGHAAETSPRGVTLALDWIHVASGSLWIGGLIGLIALGVSLGSERRIAALSVSVPRFSRVAFVSVLALIASGTIAAIIHLPTVSSLWETSYGRALLVKIGLLGAAMLFAPINMLRNTPRLQNAEAEPEKAKEAASLLRVLVSGEIVLVAAVIFAAGVLSSLPPPPKALAGISSATTRVGPGAVVKTVEHGPYTLQFKVDPNRAAVPNAFTVSITKNGQPVRGADVTTTFTMLDMEMGQLAYSFSETAPGVYTRTEPALVMVGHWELSFDVRPPNGEPFKVQLVDKATG
ncbi:MAG TPA: copper resistance protein CopC, partial [Gaiellaceae bacterium]|nr:copper resistance protein CopC [Gaiellaceae bacterium]